MDELDRFIVWLLHVEPTSKLSARCVSAALSCVRGSCVRVTGRCESSQAEPASELSARRVSAEVSCVCRPRAQDDAAGRRLGNGAKFYGKRRSSFYGEEDANRKTDPDAFDAEEDWRGWLGLGLGLG